MKTTTQTERTWMITGSSRGFGAAIAAAALAAGDAVIGTGRKAAASAGPARGQGSRMAAAEVSGSSHTFRTRLISILRDIRPCLQPIG